MEADAVEVVDESGVVRDEQEIVRALDAPESGRVVEERRQETEHEHGAGEAYSNGSAFLPRA